jgi:polar amino acid transport system substrate-binding protein
MLQRRAIDAFATNKAVLSELSDELPSSRILEGRWGVESMAIAIPKGRDAAMPWLRQFAQELRASGQLQAMVARAGLRGTARAE